ncbi:recombinase family protein [Streptomyces xiamenensis]|uniref:recombinase family protein n=1 Tax=Streptomyces xiamenensis TaxID=408015 RepID=UPI0035E06A97
MTLVEVPPTFSSGDDLEPFLGYIRVSTWKEEKISPELQKTSILDWARRSGARIVDWIIDLDESGRTFKRKIMQGIERVEKGEVAGIAVWRYSRFGRHRTGNAINLARLESVGGRLESSTEQVDASTAVGRFQRGMMLEFAAFESDRTGEAWRDTHQHRRSLGLPACGRPRWGYIWHPRRIPDSRGGYRIQEERYEIDPEIGPVLAHLYRRYVAGEGFAVLCAWLNEHGFRSTRGQLWRVNALKRYMDSGWATGMLRLHDPKCSCKAKTGQVSGTCPNHLLVQGAHEEVIDYDLWSRYKARRAEVIAMAPRARKSTYELTGLLRCAECRGYTGVISKRVDGVQISGWAYRCSRRATVGPMGCPGIYIWRHIVEEKVFEWLRDEAAAGIDAAPATADPGEPEVDGRRVEMERQRAEAEIQRATGALARLRAEHAMSPGDWGPGEYEAARDQIQAVRAEAQERLDAMAPVDPLPTRAELAPIAIGAVAEWDTLATADRSRILRSLLRRVALVRTGPGSAGVVVTPHPVWEPDPWA